ncbi:hypothetical protein [Gracilibacillus oryzae]|uniref:hypothetical protein n=1 Tax=Gracilibacillus oryzae TaxID=1672701 RepID=UPI0012977733|nr:hypothetical protein [Gracilibacillus oryzae]
MIFIGFILTNLYIYHLERKAGYSTKVIWIRVLLSIMLFLAIAMFFANGSM